MSEINFFKNISPKEKEFIGFEEIGRIKEELASLKIDYDKLKIELENSPNGISHADFPEFKTIQNRRDILNREIHQYVSVLKHDPTETLGPNKIQEQEEIKFLQKELDVLNESIGQLNMITRDEFFKNGAIDKDGNPNKTYYAFRQGLDPLIKDRGVETQNLSEQKTVSAINIDRIENIYESKEFKNLKNNLKNFMTVELAPVATKDRVDRARAFLAYCEDKGERIDIDPIIAQYDEVSRMFTQARHQLDLINTKIFDAGLRITPDDLKPYMDQINK